MDKNQVEEKLRALDKETLTDLFQEFYITPRKCSFSHLVYEIMETQRFMRISGKL